MSNLIIKLKELLKTEKGIKIIAGGVFSLVLILLLISTGIKDKSSKEALANQQQKQYEEQKQAEEQKNKEEVKQKNLKSYADLLDTNKKYEELNETERYALYDMLQEWDSLEADFKDKYQDKKNILEKNKTDFLAKAKVEADAKKAQADAKATADKAAAEAKKAEEEKIAYDTGITYDQLARTPDDYKSKKAKFTGKVIQVMESGSETNLRIAVNNNYDTVLLVTYSSSISKQRVLENDNVTVKGVSQGLYTYKSTMGGNITIPLLKVNEIQINNK